MFLLQANTFYQYVTLKLIQSGSKYLVLVCLHITEESNSNEAYELENE